MPCGPTISPKHHVLQTISLLPRPLTTSPRELEISTPPSRPSPDNSVRDYSPTMSSSLRKRVPPTNASDSYSGSESEDLEPTPRPTPPPAPRNSFPFSILDILRVLAGLLILSTGLSFVVTDGESLTWHQRPKWMQFRVLKSYFVRPPSHPKPGLSNPPPPAELSPRSHRFPTRPLQRHLTHPSHLPRAQRHHLRRVLQPRHLRPRWELPHLRRRRLRASLRHRLFRRG